MQHQNLKKYVEFEERGTFFFTFRIRIRIRDSPGTGSGSNLVKTPRTARIRNTGNCKGDPKYFTWFSVFAYRRDTLESSDPTLSPLHPWLPLWVLLQCSHASYAAKCRPHARSALRQHPSTIISPHLSPPRTKTKRQNEFSRVIYYW